MVTFAGNSHNRLIFRFFRARLNLRWPAVLAVACMGLLSFTGKIPVMKMKETGHKFLAHIPEPSDIVFDSVTGHCFIVSDHGILFETEPSGRVIRKASARGMDFEGVELWGNSVYVSDESGRKVYRYRKADLKLEKVYPVSWGGPMNKSFESISWNSAKKCFVLIVEMPATVVEYDTSFKEIAKYPLHFARTINGCRWYRDKLYMISSSNAAIFRCDPLSYEPEAIYTVRILNAEGIAFDRDGKVTVTSDNEQKIYFFNNLPNTNTQK
jgi:uncharacterized protein YjiK